MFYVKSQINEEMTASIEIHDNNVFTRCPVCGKEKQVDIQDVLQDGDLYGTAIYCGDCAKAQS